MGRQRSIGIPSDHENISVNETVTPSSRPNLMPDNLATPEARQLDAMQRQSQLQQAGAQTGPAPEFRPIVDGSDMIYLRYNGAQSTHVTSVDPGQPGTELFLLGRAQYMLDGEPFLVIDRQILQRSPRLMRLIRQPLTHPRTGQQGKRRVPHTKQVTVLKDIELEPGDDGYVEGETRLRQVEVAEERTEYTETPIMMLEQISREDYEKESEYWREWSRAMMADYEERMLHGSPAEGDRPEDRVVISDNWDAIEGGQIVF
jgi:hypothetical protein